MRAASSTTVAGAAVATRTSYQYSWSAYIGRMSLRSLSVSLPS